MISQMYEYQNALGRIMRPKQVQLLRSATPSQCNSYAEQQENPFSFL